MIEVSSRRVITEHELYKYCVFAKSTDEMQIVEWENGHGFDVFISRTRDDEKFSMTYGEFKLLKKLVKYKG